MVEFFTLRPKVCSYLIDDGDENKKAEGTQKCVKQQNLKFKDYKKIV